MSEIIINSLKSENEISSVAGLITPLPFDEKKYWIDLREEIREFNRKSEKIQESAKEQFQREIKNAVNNILLVIDKLEVEYPEMSVFFMRDVGNLFQDHLHDFNPCLYPSSDDFYEYFSISMVMKDRMNKHIKSDQSHV